MRIKRNGVDNLTVNIDYKQHIVPDAKILWYNIGEDKYTQRST